jgi:hypothetical protein
LDRFGHSRFLPHAQPPAHPPTPGGCPSTHRHESANPFAHTLPPGFPATPSDPRRRQRSPAPLIPTRHYMVNRPGILNSYRSCHFRPSSASPALLSILFYHYSRTDPFIHALDWVYLCPGLALCPADCRRHLFHKNNKMAVSTKPATANKIPRQNNRLPGLNIQNEDRAKNSSRTP